MTKQQAIYFLEQELERIELIKLRSDLTPEQKVEALRIGWQCRLNETKTANK